MKRNWYQTVTSKEAFALLIPCSASEADGEATFLPEFGIRPVRRFTLADREHTPKAMKGAAKAHFFSLIALRDAADMGDDLMLAEAKKRVERVYREREKLSSPEPRTEDPHRQQLATYLAGFSPLSPAEALKHFEGLRPGPRAMENGHRWLSYEVSRTVATLMHSQLVLWLTDGQLRPAIYCKDAEAALFVHTFIIAPTGGLGWRMCPRCNKEFFQTQSNQDYCCPQHRDTHRVARHRFNKRNAESTTAHEGKNDGTHKAR